MNAKLVKEDLADSSLSIEAANELLSIYDQSEALTSEGPCN